MAVVTFNAIFPLFPCLRFRILVFRTWQSSPSRKAWDTIIQQSLPSFLHSQQAHSIFKAVGRRSDDSRLSAPLALSISRMRTRALQTKWRKLVTPSTPAADYQAIAAADGSTSGSTNALTGTDT